MARVLVIDDERNIRKMVRLTLVKAGHEVVLAENGTQGLELFGDGASWDLTLVDQRMPDVEGREVVLEARRRDADARIMMMTAFATTELASQVLKAGAVDFLRKPFATDVLRRAVAAVLARSQYENVSSRESQPGDTRRASPKPPLISYSLNGFDFWPVLSSAAEMETCSQGLEIVRVFQVRAPSGAARRCIVGITPHVREEIRAAINSDPAENDSLWETVCQLGLSNYVWNNVRTPPEVLPIFELTPTQLYTIRDLTREGPLVDY